MTYNPTVSPRSGDDVFPEWLSPKFGPTGCLGAIVWVIVVAGAALGLVALVWWGR